MDVFNVTDNGKAVLDTATLDFLFVFNTHRDEVKRKIIVKMYF